MSTARTGPIRRKLTAVSMLTCGAALLLACIALMTYELLIFRSAAANNLDTDRLSHYAAIVALVVLVASAVALFISRRLHTRISASISHLAGVANAVAAERNYSIRAIKTSGDELGHLIDDFNEMLDQIQQRDLALREARSELEQRVEGRTKELAQSLALLNATLESSTDGIIAHQFGSGVLFYNSV